MRNRHILVAIVAAAIIWPTIHAGPLEPPVPPGNPTMKPIDQVEPRIPIYAGDLPLTINESGSYYLAESISTAGAGITVAAQDVTIDLMGFRLEGGAGPAITSDQDGTVVRNGIIVGWSGSGVVLWNESVAADLVVRYNGGSGISVGSDGRVVRCTASRNDVHGIIVGVGALVSGSTAGANAQNGIWADNALGAMIRDCVVDANYRNGIRVDGRARVVGNQVRGNDWNAANGKAGIWITGDHNHVEGNTIVGNGNGIDLDGDYNAIARNFVSGNWNNDFDVDPGAASNFMPIHVVGATGPVDPWANIEQP